MTSKKVTAISITAVDTTSVTASSPLSLNSLQDASNVLRFISGQKRRAVGCRDMRPHLVAEAVQFQSDENEVNFVPTHAPLV